MLGDRAAVGVGVEQQRCAGPGRPPRRRARRPPWSDPGAPVGPQTATTRPRPAARRAGRPGGVVGGAAVGRRRPVPAASTDPRRGCPSSATVSTCVDPEPAQPLRVPVPQVVGVRDQRPPPGRSGAGRRRCPRRGPGSVGDTTATVAVPVLAVASRSVRSTQRLASTTPGPRPLQPVAAPRPPRSPRRRDQDGDLAARRTVRALIAARSGSRSPPASAAIDVGRRASWSRVDADDHLTGWRSARARCPTVGAATTATSSKTSVDRRRRRRLPGRVGVAPRRSGVTQTSTTPDPHGRRDRLGAHRQRHLRQGARARTRSSAPAAAARRHRPGGRGVARPAVGGRRTGSGRRRPARRSAPRDAPGRRR